MERLSPISDPAIVDVAAKPILYKEKNTMVELRGIEPLTSSLRTRRSPI